jgi:outer membrane protein
MKISLKYARARHWLLAGCGPRGRWRRSSRSATSTASGAARAAPAKAAQAKLESRVRPPRARPRRGRQPLKAAADKLDKEAPTLSETERNRRQRELVEQDRDLQRKRREFQEDLNQRKNEELAGVVERANRVIKQIFDAEKYDLILQEVVFAGPRVDITEKVIRALNAGSGAAR